MFNKKNIPMIIFGIIVIIPIFYYFFTNIYSIHGNKIKKININGNIFRAEIVADSEKMYEGLGRRKGMCQSCAMSFQFSNPEKYSFSMRGMFFPLDIIWVLNGKIVQIEKNVPKDFTGIFYPQVEANQVVEINAGLVDKNGIKLGDEVNFQN